ESDGRGGRRALGRGPYRRARCAGAGAMAARRSRRESARRRGQSMKVDSLAVIGAGAWGTALAQVAAGSGRPTLLWALEDDVVAAVNDRHENTGYLSGGPLSPGTRATGNLSDLDSCDAWLVVTPAQHMRSVLERAPHSGHPLILCSKGIEERSGELLHHVARQAFPDTP